MREIECRGKRIDNGEWVYGYLIGNDVIVGNIVEWDSEYFCTEFWLKVDPETVGEYTGLKDKNGKKIYEGGIVDMDASVNGINGYRQVEFKDGAFGIRPMNQNDEELWWVCVWNMYCEVIGNIFEHEELIRCHQELKVFK